MIARLRRYTLVAVLMYSFLVMTMHYAGDNIARDTDHKEDAVDDGEREECSPVDIWLAKTLLDK